VPLKVTTASCSAALTHWPWLANRVPKLAQPPSLRSAFGQGMGLGRERPAEVAHSPTAIPAAASFLACMSLPLSGPRTPDFSVFPGLRVSRGASPTLGVVRPRQRLFRRPGPAIPLQALSIRRLSRISPSARHVQRISPPSSGTYTTPV